MNQGNHSDLGPELRMLAQAILDRLDPAVRAAAAKAADAVRGPGRCQQVWCPVCALAALVTGEEHPLLTVIAEHSVALMSVIRAMAADPQAAGQQARDDAGHATAPTGTATSESPAAPANGNGRYQPIPIVVEAVVSGGDAPGDAPEDCP